MIYLPLFSIVTPTLGDSNLEFAQYSIYLYRLTIFYLLYT